MTLTKSIMMFVLPHVFMVILLQKFTDIVDLISIAYHFFWQLRIRNYHHSSINGHVKQRSKWMDICLF